MSKPGSSSANAASVSESQGTSWHVPLQNSVCVLCRFPVWRGERIGAVIGPCEASSYSAFTLGFDFPGYGHPFKSTRVHEKKHSDLWRLCRSRPCGLCRRGEDAALYHVDCYQMISRHYKPLRLWDIWMVSIWSQPFPGSQYLAWSSFSTGFPSNIPPKLDSLAFSISTLPEELREDIVRRCGRTLYPRLLMALHRRSLYNSLVEEPHVERELPFSSVVSWSRTAGLQEGYAEYDWIRIRLDDFGIAHLEPFDNELDEAIADPAYNRRYIVETRQALKNAHIRIKGRYLRIRPTKTLQIWETPRPSISQISWYDRTALPVFVRSIVLEGITGVTAFCRNGNVHWLHPHYASERDSDAPLPAQDNFPLSERDSFTPIFFPLAKDECLESIWVRYRGLRGSRNDITLILVTNFGRPLIIGKYQHPAHAGVAFAPVQLNLGTHLLLPCHNPTFSDPNFAVVKSNSAREDASHMMVPQHLTRALLSPLDDDRTLYLSAAPFVSMKELTLFYKPLPGENKRQYIGMIIEYDDTALESMGSCYGRLHSEVVSEPTKIQAYHEDGYMNLRLSLADEWHVEILDKKQTHNVDVGETLLWWFDDRGLQMLEAETRAQLS